MPDDGQQWPQHVACVDGKKKSVVFDCTRQALFNVMCSAAPGRIIQQKLSYLNLKSSRKIPEYLTLKLWVYVVI